MGSCGPLAQDAMGVFWNVLDLHTGHGAILALLAPICKWFACCIVSPSSVSFLYKCTSKEEEAPRRPARNLCRINRLETLELDRLKWLPVPGLWALRRADPGQETLLEIALRLEGRGSTMFRTPRHRSSLTKTRIHSVRIVLTAGRLLLRVCRQIVGDRYR